MSGILPDHLPTNCLRDIAALDTQTLPACWRAILDEPCVADKLASIRRTLQQQLDKGLVLFPDDPWRALRLTPLSEVKVVILGQDPYHGPNQARGLAFSVDSHCPTPPSLRNIFKELDRGSEPGLRPPRSNDLTEWARQGVLLLNASLTVQQGAAASHARIGWQTVTDRLISAVAARHQPTVYLLWGRHAQEKRSLIEAGNTAPDTDRMHSILTANHPSPLSAMRGPTPFIGCDHFQLTNQWLVKRDQTPIVW
ncbi:uracil-DNA glycosylase [Orrella marina]|uniref:Uracil-DNA glycosylase n=1 Tax=Orrella marina TaxID=2163011 RepID=A0A2R4XL71_9BURK|nr:uracil-DNA glycosylase [Orrella marina]AWB34552.1 uracil-DNA glycosylase [Orrella marina]